MIAVADTGPLLALAKVNALDLLARLFQQAIMTPAVFTEAITAGLAQNAPDAYLLEAAVKNGGLQMRTPKPLPFPRPTFIHRGEEESIRLAIELAADCLLVDDLNARHAAIDNFAAAGVSTSVKSTLGMIVTAYQQRYLVREQAVDLVNALKARLISGSVRNCVIRLFVQSESHSCPMLGQFFNSF
jgi:predicted nucleic acid-binding protein